VPHEPHAAFWYAVWWTRSVSDWQKLHDLDAGQTLHQWHKAKIQELAPSVSAEDSARIEHHRKRSYGRSPVDEPRVEVPNLDDLINVG
jgi:hypothetical protein